MEENECPPQCLCGGTGKVIAYPGDNPPQIVSCPRDYQGMIWGYTQNTPENRAKAREVAAKDFPDWVPDTGFPDDAAFEIIFWEKVNEMRREHPEYRKGQAVFNVMMGIFPKEASELRGTTKDPFYQDKNIKDFVEYCFKPND